MDVDTEEASKESIDTGGLPRFLGDPPTMQVCPRPADGHLREQSEERCCGKAPQRIRHHARSIGGLREARRKIVLAVRLARPIPVH